MADQGKSQLNTAVLEQLAAQSNRVTNEELLLAAMFGKQLQTDINAIKKQSAEVNGSLKVSDVDMSKVMPSHILPAMGVKTAKQPVRLPTEIPQVPVEVPQQPVIFPVQVAPAQVQIGYGQTLSQDSNQLEFSFDKKARYEDIMAGIENLETKITILTNKVNELTKALDKKKLNPTDATQTG